MPVEDASYYSCNNGPFSHISAVSAQFRELVSVSVEKKSLPLFWIDTFTHILRSNVFCRQCWLKSRVKFYRFGYCVWYWNEMKCFFIIYIYNYQLGFSPRCPIKNISKTIRSKKPANSPSSKECIITLEILCYSWSYVYPLFLPML